MSVTHSSLKARCAELGITLRDLCDKAGVSTHTVSGWKRREPSALEAMRKLESALEDIYREQFEKGADA